jgi:two-component system copper resistance phosphate regulon response regulator CusR
LPYLTAGSHTRTAANRKVNEPEMKSILLIEDEINLVSFIQKGLTEEDFSVTVALTAQMGLQLAANSPFDIILLDIMLPDGNGFDLCRELRRQGMQTPILFLTALNTADNIALGLDGGGDDYLVKPFKFIELVARINAVIRRSSRGKRDQTPEAPNIFRIADLVVDDDAKSVTRHGEAISLTATEYRLLMVLVKNRGRVLSRMTLLENVWNINFNLETNVVDVYINYLRKKVDARFEPKLIRTVVGMGYVLKDE